MDRLRWNFYHDPGNEFEQPSDVLARVRLFIERVRREQQGEQVVAVSHADPIVFYWMWVLDIPLLAENRRRLQEYGLQDDYPAKASISTFRFDPNAEDERPIYSYVRPY
jgi:broad specificity phosphatase PhoE